MQIVFTAAICLIVGHLAINANFPSLPINFLGVAMVGMVLGYVLLIKRDAFAFILIIFICSQFRYANNQGGLFNLVSFLLLSIYVSGYRVRETIKATDTVIVGLIVVLFAADMIGLLLKNTMPFYIRLLQAASFSSVSLAQR